MRPAIINKINKIRSRKPQKEIGERPSLQIPMPIPVRPVEKEKTHEAPASRVIIIDLM